MLNYNYHEQGMKIIPEQILFDFQSKLESIATNVNDIINKSPKVKTWLDAQEVCSLLNITKRTLQSYRDSGVLPYSKVGGKIFFKATDIEEVLMKNYQK